MFVLFVVLAVSLLGCPRNKNSLQRIRETNIQADMARIQYPAGEQAKVDEAIPEPARRLSLDKPFSLNDAIAYALAFNLDAATAREEKAVQDELATGAVFNMLPSLIVSAERGQKSRDTPSSSESYLTGSQSLEPSISSERDIYTFSAELSWDLLNLGLGMLRWRQAGDSVSIAEQRLRRVKQNLIYDVSKAYSRAAVAKESSEQAAQMIQDLEERREVLHKNLEEKLMRKVVALENETRIMEATFALRKLLKEYESAKVELAQLMGLEQSTGFEINGFDFATLPGPLDLNLESFRSEALLNRPELYEQDLEELVSENEATQALIKMFPSITPYYRYNYDDNKYLTYNDWYTVGLRLSWDLFSVPKYFFEQRAASKQASMIRTRRASMAASILTQLNLALIEYRDMEEQARQLQELSAKKAELAETVRMEVEAGKAERAMLLDAEERSLSTKMEYHAAYARLIAAMARLDNTLGRDWDDSAHKVGPGVAASE